MFILTISSCSPCIRVALETSHAVYQTIQLARTMSADEDILLCVSGRGDKDVVSVADALPKYGPKIGWDLRFDEMNNSSK